jgi:hypothetical protein
MATAAWKRARNRGKLGMAGRKIEAKFDAVRRRATARKRAVEHGRQMDGKKIAGERAQSRAVRGRHAPAEVAEGEFGATVGGREKSPSSSVALPTEVGSNGRQ